MGAMVTVITVEVMQLSTTDTDGKTIKMAAVVKGLASSHHRSTGTQRRGKARMDMDGKQEEENGLQQTLGLVLVLVLMLRMGIEEVCA